MLRQRKRRSRQLRRVGPSSPALSASLLSGQHIRQRLYLLPHSQRVFRHCDVFIARTLGINNDGYMKTKKVINLV